MVRSYSEQEGEPRAVATFSLSTFAVSREG